MEEAPKKKPWDSTLKSLDTEEFIDMRFYRPIGYRWALLFNKLGLSPNFVTVLGIFIGIAAGICFYYQSLYINIIGMLLLVWANMYDSADGQLARMTGKKSALGRILDGLCGDLWFVTIYIAIILRLYPSWGFWILILAFTTGYFHRMQAALADYYRNAHLFFLKGKSGSELSDSKQLKKNFEKTTWKQNFIFKMFDYFYIGYTKGQESWTPHFQRMMKIIKEKYPNEVPQWFRTAFREKSLPLMKYTNMLSFNTRVIVLFISLFIDKPWLYFVFELTVLNTMLIYMVFKHERMCAGFVKQLTEVSHD